MFFNIFRFKELGTYTDGMFISCIYIFLTKTQFHEKYKFFSSIFMAGWRSIFKIGVIDCATAENAPICRPYDIKE